MEIKKNGTTSVAHSICQNLIGKKYINYIDTDGVSRFAKISETLPETTYYVDGDRYRSDGTLILENGVVLHCEIDISHSSRKKAKAVSGKANVLIFNMSKMGTSFRTVASYKRLINTIVPYMASETKGFTLPLLQGMEFNSVFADKKRNRIILGSDSASEPICIYTDNRKEKSLKSNEFLWSYFSKNKYDFTENFVSQL